MEIRVRGWKLSYMDGKTEQNLDAAPGPDALTFSAECRSQSAG